jgi:predicted TIM-barrel fold metal-dependent hydrolase
MRLLVRTANVKALLVDDGYPSDAVSLERMGDVSGCITRRIARIETVAESLFVNASSAADLIERTLAALSSQTEIVGLKTIVAYRCGLQITPVNWPEVERAFADERAQAGWNQPRLTAKPLLTALLMAALEWAAERAVPVQFHTGFGDRDIDLPSANPALLKGLLEDRRFAGAPIVLLHAAYPYSREASYLAAVYPNVWLDWSAVNPMLPPHQLQRVLEDLLAMAPYTKLLYGSDAWGIPDWIYLAARAGREALAAVLAEETEREEIARAILCENALALYHIAS